MLQTVFLLNTDVITFVEYYQGDKYMNVKPNNGKDINSIGPNKKHLNSVPKEYQHKSPHVNNLISGSAHQIPIAQLLIQPGQLPDHKRYHLQPQIHQRVYMLILYRYSCSLYLI